MKKLIILLFLITAAVDAQNLEAKSVTYVTFSPCFTNEVGTIGTKFSPTFEIGRQFQDIFTVGLALGKTNCKTAYTYGSDGSVSSISPSSYYLELRPNLNVYQIGRFTNTVTPGIGYVFGPGEALMIETTVGIEYEYTEKLHFNIFFGNYYYSSLSDDPNNNLTHFSPIFWGFSIVKFFRKTKTSALITK